MDLQKAIYQVFFQLTDSLDQLGDGEYDFPCKNLSGNTIGKHVRHIIEMFQCLEFGYENGEIDYEKRMRNKQMETDKIFAIGILRSFSRQISKENKNLILLAYYNNPDAEPDSISTNYFREIAYILEHTIHHMALIRIGMEEIGKITLEDSYGVASSTIKYRKQCVQ